MLRANSYRVNIKEVARIAKVSPSTVSLVMNDGPGVSDETRYRVQKIAKALGYRPNLVARSLVKGRSHAIAFFITSSLNPIFPELAAGMEAVLRKNGYSLSIISTHGDKELEAVEIEGLMARAIDGIITSDALIDGHNLIPLVRSGYPVVSVMRRVYECDDMDYVIVDGVMGGYLAAEHLVRMGHDRIGIIRGPMNTSTGIERFEGAVKALEDYGIPIRSSLVHQGDFFRESGYHGTKLFLNLPDEQKPTAVFATNDEMALGAFEAILDAGLRIPEDVALVGFNNVATTGLRSVEITTISQNKQEMGRLGVQRLIDKIERKRGHKKPYHVVLEPRLVIRKSCGFSVNGYSIPKSINSIAKTSSAS